jgi:hypothetical protein
MQLTHSFTQQLIHAPYAYSFLLIPCLLIAYKALTKPLPITYQSLTNSAYSLPFLYFNAVSPHVFKPLGSAQWKRAQLYEIIPLSVSLSQYPLSFLSLVGFSEGLKAQYLQVYSIYSSPSVSLGSIGV